ncbi:2-octaprenyl-6-methoxyphenyl hydroxylase [Vibrio ezurae]|uniref:2-octaprenyl-6-methoxyphenol hydroxylase n=1 Tax=Vibrio ezurae NBRC 102218 TaxID=1219080 RepID=U3AF60_9VIBR|nr:2-octaprenyl-6-methoxyphenyl hydroxylase [Vibrio ezurae]GAD78576.1 2-octaprenyl-6-methoxyphenol hydroxylase [Vibrio ezurae NBRC 102218]
MQYDVIIIGGAMSGATLALALSRVANKKVAVVEAFSESPQHPGFDARAIALSLGSIELLRRYKLWDALANDATPIDTIDVSDRGHFAQTGFSAEQQNQSLLGAVVELATVGAAYREQLRLDSNIDVFCPDSIVDIEQHQQHIDAILQSGTRLSAQLMVAADGANSKVAELIKNPKSLDDFEQHALIANIELEKPHHNKAYERFTSHGPIALLPMTGKRMSLVWCMKQPMLQQALAWNNETFLAELQQEFGWRLGRFDKVGTLASYPLQLHKRERLIHHRIAFVGNAAQTLHPIAGQGFNLGIRDVASLVDVLSCHRDCGDYQCLAQFRDAREADREATCDMTSALVRIFSNEWLPMVVARNLGLALFDIAPPLQGPVKNRSLGLV